MSVFRPAAKVTSPDGQEWEIYAYKLKLHDFAEPEDLLAAAGPVPAGINGVYYALTLVPRALMHVVDYAVAAVRAARTDEWTIDAVSYMPGHTVYSWSTTTEHKGQVLAQVEGHLARGDIALRLSNATYRGESRSAR